MKWHYVGRIFRFVGIRKLLLVLAAGAFLAGCASHVASTVVLPAVTRHGPPGSQFKASFPFPPIKSVTNGSGSTYRDFGVGFSTHTQYDSGVAPNEMDVSVTVLTKFVRPRRIDPFLRSFLATPHGVRLFQWFGLPAAEEFVPGCLPTGKCIGFVGNLVVLDGTSLYYVFTSQKSQNAALDEVHSFRLVR